ncbi:late competence development ComFB family protein [Simiduia sp. 21SJ11W-1]|uniref:late competence development ComFB family protein n=1 Tax=Simiduia sp. 21SJ11W-1 TaxID=2909669 RepID=UPI00209E191E|nr:late competence development ComFB family protein [Simiduia sp. 21SJ11W-1]UTA46595.1 late competence development ComFB family protein [Simiduia sp. 21SJ11W-1]
MLLHAGRRRSQLPAGVDSIHNYYELQVLDEIANRSSRALEDADFMADVACVALNHLPPRYIRHDVDMSFFLSPQEQEEMQKKVRKAVKDALKYVQKREQDKSEADATEA